MYHLMTKFWWILALRGIAGIVLALLAFALLVWTHIQPTDLFGLFVFAKMASVIASIIFLLGIYALIDGLFSIVLGAQDYGDCRHWKPLIAEGLLSMALGLATLLWPDNAVITLLVWVAAWAFVTGLLEIQEGFDLNEYKDRRPLFLLAGICSILFGFCIIFLRVSGLELVEVIGGYAFAFGLVLLIFAYRLRHFRKILGMS
ncbi:MAG TPA: DUF308 domain-containing protein [bacterium]|nr:DUF308 domain-containing protein [bacterium]